MQPSKIHFINGIMLLLFIFLVGFFAGRIYAQRQIYSAAIEAEAGQYNPITGYFEFKGGCK